MPTTERERLGLVLYALAFAGQKHKKQRRKDAERSPYINHPIALADILVNIGGVTDEVVLCAALLHDTVEDTETTHAELAREFGEAVAGVVREVTDDKTLSKPERKRLQVERAEKLSPAAKLVKLADKVCNLRDLDRAPPPRWSLERKRQYFDWAKSVIDGLRGASPELESAFDVAFQRRP